MQSSKKRKADKLVSAETMDPGQLRNAATLKEDKDILLDIQGKDCIALEVKYHRKYYEQYSSFVRHKKADPAGSTPGRHYKFQEAFDAFCEEFIRTKLIDEENVFV